MSEQPTIGAATTPSMGGGPPVVGDIGGQSVRRGDRIFRGLSVGASATVLVIMAAIALFLIIRSVPALRANTVNFFTFQQWLPDESPVQFGIAAMLFYTLVTGILAMIIAVPVSVICCLIAAPMGWLVARTDMPLSRTVRTLVMASLVTPPFVGAVAWEMLAAPNSGLLNQLWRLMANPQIAARMLALKVENHPCVAGVGPAETEPHSASETAPAAPPEEPASPPGPAFPRPTGLSSTQSSHRRVQDLQIFALAGGENLGSCNPAAI